MAYDIIIGRNEADRKLFGEKGVIFLGRSYVKMGRTVSLSNNLYMDMVRSHIVYVAGKRGGGKCLAGDSLVKLADGTETEIKDIETLDKKILALDRDSKIKPFEKTNFFKREVSTLLKVRTGSGKEIKLTPEHPLLTINGWKEARCLTVGSKIATANQSDIFWDEIVAIEKLEGKFMVYDITVPEVHNFVANNVIVHNSYTLGVIAEGVADLPPEIKNNIAVVMLDTMGIYWTMKHKNEKDADLLEMWGLEPKGLDIKIFTPVGYYSKYKESGIPTDVPFSIRADELTAEDWALSFGITTGDPVGIAIDKTLGDFRDAGKKNYTVEDMIEAVKNDDSFEKSTKNETVNRLRTATRWGLFSSEGTRIDTLIKGGQVTVLDVSCYATGEGGWGVKNLVVGLIAMKLFI